MHRIRFRWSPVVAALAVSVLLAVGGTAPLRAEAAASRTISPIAFDLPDPCTGEDIHFTGELLTVIHVTEDAQGNLHETLLFAFRHVQGVGLESGTVYLAAGTESHESVTLDADSPRMVFTSNATLNVITAGGEPNLQIHGTIHVTVMADGTVTADVDNFRFQVCTG